MADKGACCRGPVSTGQSAGHQAVSPISGFLALANLNISDFIFLQMGACVGNTNNFITVTFNLQAQVSVLVNLLLVWQGLQIPNAIVERQEQK